MPALSRPLRSSFGSLFWLSSHVSGNLSGSVIQKNHSSSSKQVLLSGIEDLNVTQATDTARPKSSTPASSSRTTVKMVAGVDQSPIRNESFRPLLPDNSRDSDQQTLQSNVNAQEHDGRNEKSLTMVTNELYGSNYNDLATGADGQFAPLKSDSSSNTSQVEHIPFSSTYIVI